MSSVERKDRPTLISRRPNTFSVRPKLHKFWSIECTPECFGGVIEDTVVVPTFQFLLTRITPSDITPEVEAERKKCVGIEVVEWGGPESVPSNYASIVLS